MGLPSKLDSSGLGWEVWAGETPTPLTGNRRTPLLAVGHLLCVFPSNPLDGMRGRPSIYEAPTVHT